MQNEDGAQKAGTVMPDYVASGKAVKLSRGDSIMYFKSSVDMNRVIKRGRIRRAGHMTRTGEKCLYAFGGEMGKRRGLGKDMRIILRWIFKKYGKARTGWIWLRTGPNGRLL
jgi:hypothetical protein